MAGGGTFRLVFLIKNPLPLLIALAASLVVLAKDRPSRAVLPAILSFPVVYSCVTLAERLDIGYRFMLPIHPFLYLLIACGLVVLWRHYSRRWVAVAALLAVWYVAGTISIFPYQISF